MVNLGTMNIKCFQPESERFKIGIIGPIELKKTSDQMVSLLEEEGYKNTKAERLLLMKREGELSELKPT